MRSTQPIIEKFETITSDTDTEKEYSPSLNNGFEMSQLSYAYDDKGIFTEIDYSFELGNIYAIVGASGSRKSTLLNILNGKLTDYDGTVTLSDKE